MASSGPGLDLANLLSVFPSLVTRDREATTLTIKDECIKYSVWVSFVEIYNENCHDLLVKVSEGKKKGEKPKRITLKLAEDKDGLPYVKGLREISVSSADEAYQVLMTGRENLHFAATKLNQQSSRSHCIFSLKIVRVADPSNPHLARVSVFAFCDLAGSERISKTQNVGERQKEAGNINTSLLTLGRCIKAMRHNQACRDKKATELVPFRESKLTRLFKSFLTGQGKSSLITCISQAKYLFDETIHVLKFASIASKVTIETVKEPPVKKKKERSSRFSTMMDREKSKLLSLASNASVLGRSSIAWEMPPPRAKKSSAAFGAFKPNARSTIAPGSLLPPRMSTMNISEIQEVEETVLDNTVVDAQYEGLLKLVDDLKSKLIDERKKNLSLEKNLREELCNEFNQMLVEVEQGYEQRLQDQMADNEMFSDWRLGEINKVHSKRNKRKREDDTGDFDQEDLEKHRLKSELEEKTKAESVLVQEVEDLKQQVSVMKEGTVKSKQEQDKLQAANTKLQFQLAEQQRLAAELGRELAGTETRLEEERRSHKAIRDGETDALLESERQLAKAREELTRMESDVSDLKDLIQQAADDFITKDEELRQAEAECKERETQLAQQGLVLQDLQGQLEECHILLREVNDQKQDLEQRIEELELELENQENAKVAAVQADLLEVREELRVTAGQLLAAQESQEEVEKEREEERGRAKQAEEKMLEAQQERNQLLADKTKLLQQIAEKGTRKGSDSSEAETEELRDAATAELQAKMDKLTGLNKVLTDSNESLRREKEESQGEIHSLKLKIDELKAATSVDESLFEDDEDARHQVASLNTENVLLKTSLDSAKTENESLKSEKQRLLSQLESQEAKDFNEIEEMVLKIESLEGQLRNEKTSYESKIEDISAELQNKVAMVETVQSVVKNLEEKIAEKEALLKSLNEEKEKLKESYEKSSKEAEEIKSKEKNISDLEKDLKEVSMNVINLETRNGSLEKELATKDNYIRELEEIIVEKEFQISELESTKDAVDSSSVGSLQKEISTVKECLKKAEEEKAEKIEEIQKLKSELSDVSAKVEHQEKMKEQRENLEKSVKHCQKLSQSLSIMEEELKVAKDEKKTLIEKIESAEKLLVKLKEENDEVSELKLEHKKLKNENVRMEKIVKEKEKEKKGLQVFISELTVKTCELAQVQEKVEELRKELADLTEKYSQDQQELKETKEKLHKEEEEVTTLKKELKNLHKDFDAKKAQHDREMKRSKNASDKVSSQFISLRGGFLYARIYLNCLYYQYFLQLIAEYRDTNKELQKKVQVTVTSPGDPSPTLEADDSKTDTSLIESTPMAKRRGGRGRGRGRATR